MSNIYIQEPPTNGKVLLTTTLGDIDVELWSKEAPKACRNFVQLCMEGYYNGTVFHRVIKDFIAQGGDPTGTGEGGESIYGKPFRGGCFIAITVQSKSRAQFLFQGWLPPGRDISFAEDEIHTRLRFVRRGLLAMANSGKDDNGSQFFFTLGPTQELQGKHTVFGKVTGETVYNLIKINDIHTDGNDRPIDPPKIKKTEVLSNPFDDIEPRETIKPEKKESKKKKSQSKGKKDFKLLSFGEEAEEDEEMTNQVVETMRSKGKSAHELTDDPRLSTLPGDVDMSVPTEETKATEEQLDRVRQKLKQSSNSANEKAADTIPKEKTSKVEELKKESRKLQKELKNSKNQGKINDDEEHDKESEAKVSEYAKARDSFLKQKNPVPKKGSSSRQKQTEALLEKFRNKMKTMQQFDSAYGEGDEAEGTQAKNKTGGEADETEETDEGWMSHKLDCGDSHAKVLDANVTDLDRYEIYDPRNPMTKRRNEEAKNEAKRRRKEKEQKL